VMRDVTKLMGYCVSNF